MTVPGELQRLSAQRKDAQWKLASRTSARLRCQPVEVYRLFVTENAADADLALFFLIRWFGGGPTASPPPPDVVPVGQPKPG